MQLAWGPEQVQFWELAAPLTALIQPCLAGARRVAQSSERRLRLLPQAGAGKQVGPACAARSPGLGPRGHEETGGLSHSPAAGACDGT